MNALETLIALSRYAGERFDLVQAGGGNTSVKLDDGRLYIKASGFGLSEVDTNRAWALVDGAAVIDIMEDNTLQNTTDKAARDRSIVERVAGTVLEGGRPSIETFLHVLLSMVTLHTHPLSVNVAAARKDWDTFLGERFPAALLIPYATPGIELGWQLRDRIEAYVRENEREPTVVFIQNHGLIVSDSDQQSVRETTEEVCNTLARELKLDLARYTLTNKVSALVNDVGGGRKIAMLSEDQVLHNLLQRRELFFKSPFFPDKQVYCGYTAVELDNLQDPEPIHKYMREHSEAPRVVVHGEHLFFVADHSKKARESEEVFKLHVLVLSQSTDEINYLSEEEIAYLRDWEAEKFRQKI